MFELLQAQQRLSESQTSYFQALSQYAKAIKDVHLNKGSLLAYNGIHLSEGSWPTMAYADAAQFHRRWRPKLIDYRFNRPGVVSHGEYPQHQMKPTPAPTNPPETVPTPAPQQTLPGPEDAPVPLRSTNAPPKVLLGSNPALRRLPSVNLTQPLQSIARGSNLPQRPSLASPGKPSRQSTASGLLYPGAPVGYQEEGPPSIRFAAPLHSPPNPIPPR